MNFENIATRAVAVDISVDDHTFTQPTKGFWVGGAGNLIVRFRNGGSTNITFTAVPAGTYMPISVIAVESTGTTATAMVALF